MKIKQSLTLIILFFSSSFLFSQADFSIVSASISPSAINQGENVTLSYQLRNSGSPVNATIKIGFVKSEDAILGNGDDAVFGTPVQVQANFTGTSVTFNTSFSANWQPRRYTIFIVADATNIVPNESNENNNVSSVTLTILNSTPPELEFNNCFSGSGAINSGDNYTTSFSLRNRGTSIWSGRIIVFIANANNINDRQVIYDGSTSISANASKSISTGTDQINLEAGSYRVYAAYTNGPDGDGYANSSGCSPTWSYGYTYPTHYKTLNILNSTPPELEFSSCLSGTGAINTGDNYTTSFSLRNRGTSTWSGRVKVFIANVNNINDRQDIYDSSTSISANTSENFSTGTDQINLANGLYRIYVAYTNAPTNNAYANSSGCSPAWDYGADYPTHYKTLTILNSTPPELEFSSCLTGAGAINTGDNYTTSFSLRNRGTSAWSGQVTVFIARANNINDQQIIYQNSASISANSSQNFNTGTDQINLSNGLFRVYVAYTNGPTDSYFANSSGCSPTWDYNYAYPTHYKTLTILNSIPPELEFSSCFFGNGAINSGDNYTVSFSLRNIGTSTWNGEVKVFIAQEGNLNNRQTIYEENKSISGNATAGFSTGTDQINLASGNYRIYVAYDNSPLGNAYANSSGCSPAWNYGANYPTHYKKLTILNENGSNCGNFTDVAVNTEIFNAAQCLCDLGYIDDNGFINPDNNIIREDLAKVVYLALYQGDASSIAEDFPVPFEDLQANNTPYYKYAKALSYLEYGDGISPFTRSFTNFRPGAAIEKKYALKVILEAFNIQPDYSNGGTIQQVLSSADAYGYVHKAWDMGLITSTSSNANNFITRKDVFIIIHRLLSHVSRNCADCQKDCWEVPEDDDYHIPANIKLEYLARAVNMSEGYFPYSKTSFHIPGYNLPLNFTHSYNSYLLELPTELRTICPLGEGWSHTYNSYIIEQDASDGVTKKLYVFYPNGSIHKYNSANLAVESVGVFDEMTESGNNLFIKKKNQTVYKYTKYNDIWYLSEIKDRNDNAITLAYQDGVDNFKLISSVTGTAGRRLLFYYQANTNALSRVRDLTGNRNIYFSTGVSSQNLEYYTNAKGDLETYQYGNGQERHLLKNIKLPEGNIITNTYDSNRRLATSQSSATSGLFSINVSPNYGNNADYTSEVTSPNGIKTTSKFDTDGYLMNLTNNVTNTSIIYGNDKLPSQVDYSGIDTDIDYDDRGNVLKITRPEGIIHRYTYNAFNDIKSYTDPRLNTTNFYYDANKNLDYVTDNMGFQTNMTINSRGLMTYMINPEGISYTFNYDTHGNQTAVNAPLGLTSTTNYDNIGRMTRLTNPKNQVTNYSYDVRDLVKTITRISTGGNILTKYDYDKNKNLAYIENTKGNRTTFTYNDDDLMETMTFGNDTKRYDYRNDNLLDKFTKPDGTMLQNTYDAQGRLKSDGYISNYVYDNRNNIKRITKDGQTTRFNYDDLDRVDNYNDIYGKTVDYDYDKNNNITKITYPSGFAVNYTYDDNNRLFQVTWTGETVGVRYFYHKDGRLRQTVNANNTFCDYHYDAAGRMTTLINSNSSGTIIAGYAFTLDELGNHLTEEKVEPYGIPSLTAMSNTGTYNTENEITNYAGTTFQFDANGNQTKKGNTNATFDKADKLTSYGNNSYVYDGLGFMRQATRNGSTKRYVWDISGMGNILAETNSSGTPQYYYIHGLGLAARVKANNTSDVRYYHYDFRGSTIAMTNSSRNITHQYSYLPFGGIANESEGDGDNPFKFVGKYGVMNEGNDISFMRARFYDAQGGRFMSEDPVWNTNLFNYASNNPISNIDPMGTTDFNIDGNICIFPDALETPNFCQSPNTEDASIGYGSISYNWNPNNNTSSIQGCVGSSKVKKYTDGFAKLEVCFSLGNNNEGNHEFKISPQIGIANLEINSGLTLENGPMYYPESLYCNQNGIAPVATHFGTTMYTTNCLPYNQSPSYQSLINISNPLNYSNYSEGYGAGSNLIYMYNGN